MFFILVIVGAAAIVESLSMRTNSRSMYMSAKKKIVITGLGCVTPVGHGADVAYKAMCEGKSGVRRLPSWADEYPAQVCCTQMIQIIF